MAARSPRSPQIKNQTKNLKVHTTVRIDPVVKELVDEASALSGMSPAEIMRDGIEDRVKDIFARHGVTYRDKYKEVSLSVLR